MLPTQLRRLALAAAVPALVLPCLLAGPASAAGRQAPGQGPHHPQLAFRGESRLPAGATFAGTVVGGLSSIAYDRRRDVYYALSDDQGAGFTPASTPARFYTLDVDLGDGRLDPGDVTVLAVTTLRDADGQPFAPLSLDPEGLTLTPHDRLVITSEGIASRGIAPFVREFDLSGRQVAELPVPGYFDPVDGTHGVRQNLGFEAAAVAPHGHSLFVGAENALAQDGPPATTAKGSNARLLRYHLGKKHHRGPAQEWVYPTEKVVAESSIFTVNGLVELLPLDNEHLLTMERSFSVGAGNTIRIFSIDLHGATNVARIDDLDEVKKLRTVRKTLLLDLDDLGLTLDNIEGMTLGARLPDGSQSLLLVSDNNFTPGQVSQFLLFALR